MLAAESMEAYISACSFMLVLTPDAYLEKSHNFGRHGKPETPSLYSWRTRGWCMLELIACVRCVVLLCSSAWCSSAKRENFHCNFICIVHLITHEQLYTGTLRGEKKSPHCEKWTSWYSDLVRGVVSVGVFGEQLTLEYCTTHSRARTKSQVLLAAATFGVQVGLRDFTCCMCNHNFSRRGMVPCDKIVVTKILAKMLTRTINFHFANGDFPMARWLLSGLTHILGGTTLEK